VINEPADSHRRLAVHEAGHAAAATLLRGTIPAALSVRQGDQAAAHRQYPLSLVAPGSWDSRPSTFEADLLARLAGTAAERAILGDADPGLAAEDERVVLDALLAKQHGDPAEAAINELRTVATAFVAEARPVIEAAADELAGVERMSGPAFAAWVRSRIE
jgi:hypothetical protein